MAQSHTTIMLTLLTLLAFNGGWDADPVSIGLLFTAYNAQVGSMTFYTCAEQILDEEPKNCTADGAAQPSNLEFEQGGWSSGGHNLIGKCIVFCFMMHSN